MSEKKILEALERLTFAVEDNGLKLDEINQSIQSVLAMMVMQDNG